MKRSRTGTRNLIFGAALSVAVAAGLAACGSSSSPRPIRRAGPIRRRPRRRPPHNRRAVAGYPTKASPWRCWQIRQRRRGPPGLLQPAKGPARSATGRPVAGLGPGRWGDPGGRAGWWWSGSWTCFTPMTCPMPCWHAQGQMIAPALIGVVVVVFLAERLLAGRAPGPPGPAAPGGRRLPGVVRAGGAVRHLVEHRLRGDGLAARPFLDAAAPAPGAAGGGGGR